MEIEKTKTTFVVLVLKVVYEVVLVLSISNFFINKISQVGNMFAKKVPSRAHLPICMKTGLLM